MTLIDDFLAEWSSADPYITAHTSGSTGRPKEIRLAKADMLVSARATCDFFGITSASHLVMPLSVNYIAGKMMVVRSIVSGAKLTAITPSRNLEGLSAISEPIDLLPIVPSQLDGLLSQTAVCARLRNLIIGGAPLTAEQEQAVAATGINAYATYGMTETCSHVALRRIGEERTFTAMPGITFTTDADDCLIINAPEYTSRRFITTDIVELIDARHFRWLGRKDHVINTGGIKILPEDAEERLRPYFQGLEYFITSRPSQLWGQEMVMVIANHGTPIDLTPNLKAASILPHHLLPKAIIQVHALEYNQNGKVVRHLP